MLSNWSAYFDSKTGTQSFYEVDYKSLALKCGSSVLENPSFSNLKTATHSSNTCLTEFKNQFQTLLRFIRESTTQEQPWANIKKVLKVIENIVAYTYIEELYLKKAVSENKDLQVSPSLSFTIQRLVRLVKDVHLLCIYAKKKDADEFKETRRVLKEAMRGMRKSCLLFIKTYSTEQSQQTINPVREILMAQFLQLVKFLINFSKIEDHHAYVNFCSSGSSDTKVPDIWLMTDCSIKQAANGTGSIMFDSRKDLDNLQSLAHLQSKSRNSVVSTVHDLCSLGDILVKKRDFTKGIAEHKASIGDLDGQQGLGSPIKQKSTRRRTADNQEKPDPRLLKETSKLYANTGRVEGVKGTRRSNSLSVADQLTRKDRIYEVKEADESNFAIEEQSGEASPKKNRERNLEIREVQEKVTEVIKIYNEEKEQEEPEEFERRELEPLKPLKLEEQEESEERIPQRQLDRKFTFKEEEIEELDLIQQKGQEEYENPNNEEIDYGQDDAVDTHNEKEVTLTEIEEILLYGSSQDKRKLQKTLEEEKQTEKIASPKPEENSRDTEKDQQASRMIQFQRKLRAVSVGRNALLQLVKPEEVPQEETEVKELEPDVVPECPQPIVRSTRRVKTLEKAISIRNDEIETAGLPRTIINKERGSSTVNTAALKDQKSQLLYSLNPLLKRQRSSSFDAIQRKNGREKRQNRKSKESKKSEQDHCFTPKQQQEKRTHFLERTFGIQNMTGVERSHQDAYDLFHQKYNNEFEERSDDFRRKSDFGKKRLACIPYVAPESINFFAKLKVVRKVEAKLGPETTKDRTTELWGKLRQAVSTKAFLWKLGYNKSMDISSNNKSDSSLLKYASQEVQNNLVTFKSKKTGRKEVTYTGIQRKAKEVPYMKHMYQGHFIPEEDRECEDDFNDLETNLMLARLTYNRKGKWGLAFSFKSKGYPSLESKDISRDISRDVSRDRSQENSRENSGSAISSTKRGSLLKNLFRSNTSADNSMVLSPSNRSMSDSRDQSWLATPTRSKPSLFKNLLKLHPMNDANSSASPKTNRSRASSKASIRENLNMSASSSPRNNAGPLSCPKRPSLFKSLFKSNATREDEIRARRGTMTSREPSTPSSPGWKTCRD